MFYENHEERNLIGVLKHIFKIFSYIFLLGGVCDVVITVRPLIFYKADKNISFKIKINN
jgi:hypothetical protein